MNWHYVDAITNIGIYEALRSSAALERYYVEFLSLGWKEDTWNALLSWIKKRDLPMEETLQWARKATTFGISLPEDLDIDEWERRVRGQLPKLWSDNAIIERFLSKE